jgi:aromatic ring-opening dioxygenase catalytic subunit (LigB family)
MANSKTDKTPVYFLGIGGPNFIENTSHPAYAKLAAIGQEITHTHPPPKAIVVFSAHWQASRPNTIEINVAEDAGIIYDFYGFPDQYYQVDYPNRGSKEVAEKVIGLLEGKGVEVERVKRGLDHGIWAGFIAGKPPLVPGKCAFLLCGR